MERFLLYLLLLLAFTYCKRHRKINVEGVLSDSYTGQPIPNANIELFSFIEQVSVAMSDSKTYTTTTDSQGHYSFNNAYFSKPGFSGNISVHDPNYIGIMTDDAKISKKDAKLIGKTNLTRNLSALCNSKLNLTENINPSYNWRFKKHYLKFNGVKSTFFDNFSEFSGPLNILIGYTDGLNIIKTELIDAQNNVFVTKYDTIKSNGCGSTNDYTININ